jgi:hypothetical protein
LVKLFKKKDEQQKRNFRFETSLKLKSLPLEEYAHVTYAFQTTFLRFERMLKESLLEGYITSTTLERISREFNLTNVRNIEIPDTPSLREIFGSELVGKVTRKKPDKIETAAPSINAAQIPKIPSTTPPIDTQPKFSPKIKPTIPTLPTESVEARPTLSFSFPNTPAKPNEIIRTPSPTPSPSSPSIKKTTPPTIPKISFPSMSKPTSPTASPLAQSKGRREEDRATGIAILRKQMLTELKKIRSVVSEQDR